MTNRRTRCWLDLLLKVVQSYNHSIHSTTGMKPVEARNDEKSLQVYRNTIRRYPLPVSKAKQGLKYKFDKGDLVRIYKSPGGPLRLKGYLPRFTWEIFRVRARANKRGMDRRSSIPAYILEDLQSEEIEHAVFYEDELSLVDPSQLQTAYPVREILVQKKDKQGKEWVKVWWQGGQKKDAQWIERKKIV